MHEIFAKIYLQTTNTNDRESLGTGRSSTIVILSPLSFFPGLYSEVSGYRAREYYFRVEFTIPNPINGEIQTTIDLIDSCNYVKEVEVTRYIEFLHLEEIDEVKDLFIFHDILSHLQQQNFQVHPNYFKQLIGSFIEYIESNPEKLLIEK